MSLNLRAPVKGASIMHNIRNIMEPNVIFRKLLEKSSVRSRVYVAMAEGAYLYEAAGHRLRPVAAVDVRSKCGNRGRLETSV